LPFVFALRSILSIDSAIPFPFSEFITEKRGNMQTSAVESTVQDSILSSLANDSEKASVKDVGAVETKTELAVTEAEDPYFVSNITLTSIPAPISPSKCLANIHSHLSSL
jgi:hypothetical protein